MAYSITAQLIMAAAQARGWSVEEINPTLSFYALTDPNNKTHYIRSMTSVKSSTINTMIADHKDLFHAVAQRAQFAVPETLVVEKYDNQSEAFLARHSKVVVKPTNEGHGHGVTVDVTTEDQLQRALAEALTFGDRAIIQEQIAGEDHRLLYIDKKLAAAAIRKPASVIGDGTSTVEQLIDAENSSGKRAHGYQQLLTVIDVVAAKGYLGEAFKSVPLAGQTVQVIGTSNIGRGGVAIDVTDTISSELTDMAQRIVDTLDMGLCGVDIMAGDPAGPRVIEINASPTLGLHENPYEGVARNTPDKYLDWLQSN